MNRFVYGQGWVFADQTDGADANGATGGGKAGGDEDVEIIDQNAEDPAAGGKEDEPAAPKSMDEAIKVGLEKLDGGEKKEKVEQTAEEKAAAAAATAAGKETDTTWANGKPKKDDKGNELDDKGTVTKKAEAPKAKTSTELDLKPEEKKLLGAKAQARFSEVITTLKSREAEIATLTEQMKPLAEARDGIMGVLEETHTTPDQLSAYLEFNRMLQSGDPKDLESALGMVEAQRAAIYTALGREPEGGGVDLLAEFPDLKEKVAEAHMTREAALEVAAARRAQAANQAQTQRVTQQRENAAQVKKAREDALGTITAWTTDLSTKDIDYKAKEEKLLEQVDKVIQSYPPNQWLPTLQLLYSGIKVEKAAPARKENTPIRPSGAKPGAKAPQNMFEAMWGKQAP